MRVKAILRSLRRIIIITIITSFMFIVSAELFFRFVDPLGIYGYISSLAQLYDRIELVPGGYRIESGTHEFNQYTATILENGTRIVPETNAESTCTLVAIGDSVTFGQSVDDGLTWVDVLAQSDSVNWINAARPGYNIDNLIYLPQEYEADGYVWLVIQNDHALSWTPRNTDNRQRLVTSLYLRFSILPALQRFSGNQQSQTETTVENPPGHWLSGMEQMEQYPVLKFGWDTPPASWLDDVILIDRYTSLVNPFDGHPDAEGHRQLADTMRAEVDAFIEDVCPGDDSG